ncbi:MAG: GNAT family N-acetyltransferase [Anaerolineae bacterium]|jgi:RimJ/RimL family protein N-acetyltransferase|nr:GNAT family N-acetyltransferase [Anaerolineae bacterium]
MWYALAVTKRYYASWLDVSPECLELPGIVTVPSPKREIRQQGYGRCFDVYAYIAGETTIISYHRQLGEHIEAVREAFGHSRDPGSVCRWLSEGFGWRPSHELKYVFTGLPSGLEAGFARRLTVADYADFLRFHQEQYPTGEQEAWLEAYFVDLVARGCVYGVYADGRLVSATDMPDVPYMADEVAEPGINTLAGYRQRGYARNVVVALLKHLIEMRVVPLWSCAASNVASQHLAECVGYRRLADVITLTL